ncbi:hypothetical protein SAMN05443667_111141 [Flavobacterium gillisiae]|uniref:Uncharacterized protein n=1 Tax=Flavobacterium gillisiae TaxID=150146 RepID=A0A1H4F1I8_9FLAO|nr:hypothetical protein [Flavobacterium gillisiae]SEA91091.1 hypothetical protein SAMN05443667_111141 [Flavobacterium gillisiae]
MKKILLILAIALFTVTVGAQEAKTVVKATANKDACCAKKESAKTMTADEIAKCKVKCKAEGKKCDIAMADTHGEKCSSKAMTAAEVAKCKAKCKAEGKTCDATMAGTEEKKCCAKKA